MSMVCSLREADEYRIEQLLSNPQNIFAFLREAQETSLDKAWHGIHYLLTESAWGGEEPFCYLVTGGEEIGDVDVGYGPARALRPALVAAWDKALSKVAVDELCRRFDPKAMSAADIYPDIWEDEPEEMEETLDYLQEYYDVLRSFVRRAAEQGKGIIICIS